jgi:predicted choloylglycine hydrolase
MVPLNINPEVVELETTFRAIDAGSDITERMPQIFAAGWPAYRAWFLREGEPARASYAKGARMLRKHLPELYPTYERLVEAVGGGDLEARFLSHWNPPPLFAACSIATLTDLGTNVLVRNYDYPPLLCDSTLLASSFNGTRVMSMSDCVWGALDGVNEHGLSVAIAFGGRPNVGEGFGIGLVIRYILEFAKDVPKAISMLRRIPVQLSYNVALVDASGRSAIAYISPDRKLKVSKAASVANRQGHTDWPEHADFCDTVSREEAMSSALATPGITKEALVARFLEPPIYRSTAVSTWGTVYTAAYDVGTRTVDLLWPDDRWHLSLDDFVEDSRPRRSLVLVPPPTYEPAPLSAPTHQPLLIV